MRSNWADQGRSGQIRADQGKCRQMRNDECTRGQTRPARARPPCEWRVSKGRNRRGRRGTWLALGHEPRRRCCTRPIVAS
eukprot:6014875-Pleurochrysis_carterae.AAC.1